MKGNEIISLIYQSFCLIASNFEKVNYVFACSTPLMVQLEEVLRYNEEIQCAVCGDSHSPQSVLNPTFDDEGNLLSILGCPIEVYPNEIPLFIFGDADTPVEKRSVAVREFEFSGPPPIITGTPVEVNLDFLLDEKPDDYIARMSANAILN